ncbi:hypothetical protein AYI69_g5376 [Smittium culicis]|uniref:Uncharacterized protein n=1 Tax=Smittium culicis TaxID=133412 RepID=A0A1R1Y6A1_9FUNG|nr:hypothetical protein AYI69_g5376 [Smittium culicis]
MLIERLISHADISSSNYEKLCQAYGQVSSVAIEINESKRRLEQQDMVRQLVLSSNKLLEKIGKSLSLNSVLSKSGELHLLKIVSKSNRLSSVISEKTANSYPEKSKSIGSSKSSSINSDESLSERFEFEQSYETIEAKLMKTNFSVFLLNGMLMLCKIDDKSYTVLSIYPLETKMEPASLIENGSQLRVVDEECILYFSDSNLDYLNEWKESINSRFENYF